MKLLRRIGFVAAIAGSASIEFAFLAPVLVATSFGIYEFGRWAWTLEGLQEAASRGARCAGIGQASCESGGSFNSANTVSYVQGVASGWGLSLPSGDVTVNNSTSCGGVSGFSQVQISYAFSSVVAKLIPSGSSGTTMTLTSCYPNTPAAG